MAILLHCLFQSKAFLKNPTGLGGTHDPVLINLDAALVYLLEEY